MLTREDKEWIVQTLAEALALVAQLTHTMPPKGKKPNVDYYRRYEQVKQTILECVEVMEEK